MKYPFFVKSALVACSALALMNCGEDAANIANQVANNADIAGLASSASAAGVTVSEACWVVNADQTYLINTSYIVTDVNGSPVGVYDPATQSITAVNGTPILNSVDLGTLEVKAEGDVIIPVAAASSAATAVLPGASSASVLNPALSSAATTPATSSPSATLSSATVVVTSSATVPQAASSNSQQQQQQAKSSSSQQQQAQQGTDGTCLDAASGKNVKPYENLSGKNGESYAYKEDCSINCYYDPANANCASIATSNGSNNNNNNNQQQAKSSSSQQQQAKSSSSQQQQAQSSSSQQSSNNNTSAELPKVVAGGKSGSGYATRYWDSCKPHCAWEGKGGPVARTCNADGVSKASSDASSVCDGGNAGTCFDQTPQIVNDNLAYAFAATPGGGNDCGKCYMLTFKGTGASATSTPTDEHHQKIKGKHLIVMSNNIGYDVSHNQFDLMIPGGGPGAFNGCGKMGISCSGAQYGGFLSTCNYDKQCLIDMCKKEYSNASLQKGCLFLAEWMDAANNPEVDYVEVECPAALSAKY